jgi:hypothetical protein
MNVQEFDDDHKRYLEIVLELADPYSKLVSDLIKKEKIPVVVMALQHLGIKFISGALLVLNQEQQDARKIFDLIGHAIWSDYLDLREDQKNALDKMANLRRGH